MLNTLASTTDPVANGAVNVGDDLGLPGIFLLVAPESAGIPIPSEATMLFAGFNVDQGRYSLFAAVAVGTVANIIGSWILYPVGYYGRSEMLVKHGKKLHVTPERIAQSDHCFEVYGTWAVFFSRMLLIVRTFISLPAGVAHMPFWKFTLTTFAGCLPWILVLTLTGKLSEQTGSAGKTSSTMWLPDGCNHWGGRRVLRDPMVAEPRL